MAESRHLKWRIVQSQFRRVLVVQMVGMLSIVAAGHGGSTDVSAARLSANHRQGFSSSTDHGSDQGPFAPRCLRDACPHHRHQYLRHPVRDGSALVGEPVRSISGRGEAYANVDFDLESVSFWQGMDRLMEHSLLDLGYGGDGWFGLGPDAAARASVARRTPAATPVARPSTVPLPRDLLGPTTGPSIRELVALGSHYRSSSTSIHRTNLQCSPIVIDKAQGDQGSNVEVRPDHPAYESRYPWQVHVFVYVGVTRPPPATEHLTIFRGHLPVTVVTKTQSVELPLKNGAKAMAGPWEFELIEDGAKQTLANGEGSWTRHRITLGMERRKNPAESCLVIFACSCIWSTARTYR